MGAGATKPATPSRQEAAYTKVTGDSESVYSIAEGKRRKRQREEKEYHERVLRDEMLRRQEEERQAQVKELTQKLTTLQTAREEVRKKKAQVEQQEIAEQVESKKTYQGATDPDDEEDRLAALQHFKLLDTKKDKHFDRLTEVAASLFKCKTALVSLVDKHRQWFKSSFGLDASQTCRNVAFCAYVVKQSKVFVVRDATKDDRFKDNPLVAGPPYLRFYAGAPLAVRLRGQVYNLGSFCVIDYEPHPEFDEQQEKLLGNLGEIVVREIELFKRLQISQQNEKIQAAITQFGQKAINQKFLVDSYLLAVLTIAENMNDLDYVHIVDGGEEKATGAFGWSVDGSHHTFMQDLLLNTETLVINDAKDPEEIKQVKNTELFEKHGIRSALVAQIFLQGKPFGIVGVYKTEKYVWTVDEANFLESFAKSLSSVAERDAFTKQVEQEKKRADDLLLNILPQPISVRMKAQETNIADGITNATILFADIVGFTELSSRVTPKELVTILNYVFSAFDRLAQHYQLEKVKTIGDCYMLAGGLLNHEDDHSLAILRFALDMLDIINSAKVQEMAKLNVRVGVNSGPVVAGVIGLQRSVYDVWGDAVNVASRMESHGVPGRVQISASTHALLVAANLDKSEFTIEERGMIKVKGKGEIMTYFVGRGPNRKGNLPITLY